MYSCIVYIILAIISSHSDLKYWQGLKFYYFLHRVMLTFGLLKVFSGIFHNFSFSFFSKSVVFWLLLCSLFVLMHIGCSSRQLGTPGTGVLLHTGLSACTKQTSALYPAMTLINSRYFPATFQSRTTRMLMLKMASQDKARATCRISLEARLARLWWYLLTSTMGGRGLGWRWDEQGGW